MSEQVDITRFLWYKIRDLIDIYIKPLLMQMPILVFHISKLIEGETTMKVKCVQCKGKGYYMLQELGINVECSVCGGRGSFEVPDGKKLCPDCKGSGRVPMDTGLGFFIEAICEKCGKTGFVDDEEVLDSDLADK